MTSMLERCLADLEARIDPAVEEANQQQWAEFLDGRIEGEVFVPSRPAPKPSSIDWPNVHINDAIDDPDQMLLDQFRTPSQILADANGGRLSVRCNYGTGILPSLLGGELFIMPRETNTLPTTRPLHDTDRVKAVLEAGAPDLHGGLAGRVFECAERYRDIFARYPKIGRWVELYHPDMQGPIDIVELLWGSEMFLAFHDAAELLHDVLALVTETFIRFMHIWQEAAPRAGRHWAHWSVTMAGHVLLPNDSLMNLSPQAYVEFVRPRDQQIFDEFGGGAIHFCGRGEHFIEAMAQMRGLTAVHLSQPEYNDMEHIYRHTVDKGIKLLALSPQTARRAARPLRGRVHCTTWN